MAENEIPSGDLYTPEQEAMSAYSAFFTWFLQLGLTIVHGLRLYSDLHTKERKVLDYRDAKPEITRSYKQMAYLTYICVCGFLVILTAEVIQFNFTPGECENMYPVHLINQFGYFSSKCCLYLTFALRLHQVYGQSAYGYKRSTLICVAATTIIISIALLIIHQYWTITYTQHVDDTDNSFPYFCLIQPEGVYLYYIALLMIIFDVFALTAAMIAFIIPLNKVIKAVNENSNGQINKQLAKMMYSGAKYKILVVVSAVSTFLWIFLIFFGLVAVASFIGQLDFFINPLCLVLMTPYYPSDKYYERCCYLCILCCDRNRKSYQNAESDKPVEPERTANFESTVVKSVGSTADSEADLQVDPTKDQTQ